MVSLILSQVFLCYVLVLMMIEMGDSRKRSGTKKVELSRDRCKIDFGPNVKRTGPNIKKPTKKATRRPRSILLADHDYDDEQIDDYERMDSDELSFLQENESNSSDYDGGILDHSSDDIESEFTGRLWGDGEISAGRAPWSASIHEYNPQQRQWYFACSGSFITPQVVITAAHCFGEAASGKAVIVQHFMVKYNTNRHGETEKSGNRLSPSHIVIHPSFRCGQQVRGHNSQFDIGLIFFDEKMKDHNGRNGGVNTVLFLPRSNDENAFWSDDRAFQLEFVSSGSSYLSERQNILKERKTYLFHRDCAHRAGAFEIVLPYHACTARGSLLICPGDSGAPFVARFRDRKPVVVAIVSLGHPNTCELQRPPDYRINIAGCLAVNVWSHMRWILGKLRRKPWEPLRPIYDSWGVTL